MPRLLLVAPQFPPCNLAAVHRSRYFAMHLPSFGWSVTVLTVAESAYEGELDPDLCATVPEAVEVVRVSALPVRPIRWLGDVGLRALPWLWRASSRLLRQRRYDFVYLPIPPNYQSVLGRWAYERFRVPYGIDYIDPWVHHWTESRKLGSKAWFAHQIGARLEPYVLRHARLLTAVAPGYYQGPLERYRWLAAERCAAMPYGAEPADYALLKDRPRPLRLWRRDDGLLHCVYAGALLPAGVAVLRALLRALPRLAELRPDLADRLRLHFIGTGRPTAVGAVGLVEPEVRRLGVQTWVAEHPERMPFLDVLNHLQAARAVLVLGSTEAHYTPSKIFQGILSERPVLAVLHRASSAGAILEDSGAGRLITFDSAAELAALDEPIARALIDVLERPQGLPLDEARRRLGPHSARASTAALVAALERVGVGRGAE
jgi:hypothetical protein